MISPWRKYEEIVADYNREKDRVIIEETFRRLTELVEELDAEQRRAVEEDLGEDELALFDLLKKEDLGKAARERVKQASRDLLASIRACLRELDRFWEKEQTRAEIEVFILDEIYASLPAPPFTPEEKEAVAAEVYAHVWQQAVRGELARAAYSIRRAPGSTCRWPVRRMSATAFSTVSRMPCRP